MNKIRMEVSHANKGVSKETFHCITMNKAIQFKTFVIAIMSHWNAFTLLGCNQGS